LPPRARASPGKPGEVPGRGSPRPFTILVIDGDETVLSTLVDLLATHGHRVVAGTGGRRGLTLARTEQPDLILVDYHMPEMDGLAVVEALKGDATTRSIPMVAVTSGTAADANRLVKGGCAGSHAEVRRPDF
jgi:CheY-like chemotaxis protein